VWIGIRLSRQKQDGKPEQGTQSLGALLWFSQSVGVVAKGYVTPGLVVGWQLHHWLQRQRQHYAVDAVCNLLVALVDVNL